MANDSTAFLYWYRRYKVRAVDMTNFQEAMVETARGVAEAGFGAAVLKGFQVTPGSGSSVNVSAGIASAPSGYLEVINEATVLDVSEAVSGAFPCRSLVVVTAVPTDANNINSPTDPSLQVPLNSLQEAEIFLIPGTPSQNPVYPSKGPNDTILCGLIVPPGTTQITTSMFDFEVRDSLGVNSLIAQNQVRFADRLRPYRNTPTVLGVKPSQNVGSGPFGFTYPGRLNPSKYPLAGGNYSSADSFYDFATGVITGGDSTTPMFSPFIPSGNKSVVCLVVLTSADVLKFNFGNAGG